MKTFFELFWYSDENKQYEMKLDQKLEVLWLY